MDALDAGTQPEQVELAIRQALQREMITPRRLRAAAAQRPDRVRPFVEQALSGSRHADNWRAPGPKTGVLG